MILAFDSIGDRLRFALITADGKPHAEKSIAADPTQKIPRFDLLKELAQFLEEKGVKATDLAKIIFVRGPGRFTAVRTACIVANAFAAQTGALLTPISKTELEAAENDFAQFVTGHSLGLGERAEPLFDAPPSIHANKIAASDTPPL